MKNTKLIAALCLFSALLYLNACSTDEGEGGMALITGKIFVQDYNSSGILKGEYYAPDEDVYIIYGDDPVYGDVMKTHFDGTYRFDYLRKGNYTIFAYSDCDTCMSGVRPVLLSAEITTGDQVLELPDIVLRK
jgi:hypothetical protein